MSDLTKDKIVWVFREPRSGSTWFTQRLCKLLERDFLFFGNRNISGDKEIFFARRTQEKDDYKRILNTHHYCGLKNLENYDDPVIFNVTRRNRTEQFLSYYLAFKYAKSKNRDISINLDKSKVHLFPNYEKHKVSETEVREFCAIIKKNNLLWKDFSNNYRNETIYYEDLVVGYKSNILNTTLSMQNDSDTNLPIKLPYNKHEIVLNYSQIEKIILDITS